MVTIAENIRTIRKNIPRQVTLVVVTKTQSNERILEAYETGERVFGENRVQDLIRKYEALPRDVEWHMIGHLQKNKVKNIAPFVSLIHSIDKVDLIPIIEKEAAKHGRTIRIMLQFHVAVEETKFGLDLKEAQVFLAKTDWAKLKHISVVGVMGMATFTDNELQVRNEFLSLKKIFDTLKAEFFSQSTDFREISMGMSGDYQIAIEQGSTMVRLGSSIFGNRS